MSTKWNVLKFNIIIIIIMGIWLWPNTALYQWLSLLTLPRSEGDQVSHYEGWHQAEVCWVQ